MGELTSIDLFAGCGGLTRGLESAGFECLAFNELITDAADSFSENFPDAIRLEGDIRTAVSNQVIDEVFYPYLQEDKRIDLVCGGPPCQGYSGIGHRRSNDVEKKQIPTNKLYHEMIRVIERIQPNAFLFENVGGILSGKWTADGKKGEIFFDVWEAFDSIEGYVCQPGLLRAYGFGVPQNRPRVMIVGVRGELLEASSRASSLSLPRWLGSSTLARKAFPNWRAVQSELENNGGLLPTWDGSTAPDLIDVIGDLDFEGWSKENQSHVRDPESNFQEEMREGLGEDQIVTDHQFSNHSPRIVKRFQYMIDNGITNQSDLPEKWRTRKFSQKLLTARWGESKPWITVTSLPDDYVHYAKPRALSVREWARLQTFPDRHVFMGKRTTGGHRRAGNLKLWRKRKDKFLRDLPKYTQIGNAVPPRMAKAVGEHIALLIDPEEPEFTHKPVGDEREQVRKIVSSWKADNFDTIRLTETMLSKSIIDANEDVRDFLVTRIMDFKQIPKGKKKIMEAKILSHLGNNPTKMSFYRPKAKPDKPGDPRICPYGLKNHATEGDLLLLMSKRRELQLAVVRDYEDGELESLQIPRHGEVEMKILDAVERMVNLHDQEWLDSVNIEKRPADKDIGDTVEFLGFGKLPDSSEKPDILDEIEIKAGNHRNSKSTAYAKVPGIGSSRAGNWKESMSLEDICRNYGRPDSKGRKYAIKNDITALAHNSHGFILKVPREEGKLIGRVEIWNILDNESPVAVYDFARLRDKLYSKHPNTIWVEATSSEDRKRFKLDSIVVTRGPIFGRFIEMLESGEITYDFRTSFDPPNKSRPRDHGMAFRFKRKESRGKIFSNAAEFDLAELSSMRKRSHSEFSKYVLELI